MGREAGVFEGSAGCRCRILELILRVFPKQVKIIYGSGKDRTGISNVVARNDNVCAYLNLAMACG